MEHLGTRLLQTDRLILRRFAPEDAQAMFNNWASDSEVTKYLMWPTHENVSVSRHVLEQWMPTYENPATYLWAIVLKTNGLEPIGSIGAVQLNKQAESAHIGYCIGRRWWHQGIVSEALKAIMDYLFDEVGVNRIESLHDPHNPNSGKVMQKCGMRYEGTLRASDWNNQGISDACYYALLKSERETIIA